MNIYLFILCYRYLATGGTFVSLSLYFAREETTVGCIVAETTKIIWEVLNKVYMPVFSGSWRGSWGLDGVSSG
jgi:hypothetical protein